MNCRPHSANRSCVASPYPFARIAARSRSSRPDPCVDVGAFLHSTTGFGVMTDSFRLMFIRSLTERGGQEKPCYAEMFLPLRGKGRTESAYVQVRPLKTEGNTMQSYRCGLFLGGSLLAVALAAFLLGGSSGPSAVAQPP